MVVKFQLRHGMKVNLHRTNWITRDTYVFLFRDNFKIVSFEVAWIYIYIYFYQNVEFYAFKKISRVKINFVSNLEFKLLRDISFAFNVFELKFENDGQAWLCKKVTKARA